MDKAHRVSTTARGQLSYPYLFERRPGELWIIPGFFFARSGQNPCPANEVSRAYNLKMKHYLLYFHNTHTKLRKRK
jgi:hypothetical protein